MYFKCSFRKYVPFGTHVSNVPSSTRVSNVPFENMFFPAHVFQMFLPKINSFRHMYFKCSFRHMYFKCYFQKYVPFGTCSFRKYVPSGTCISNITSGNFETFQHVCYLPDFLNLPSGTNWKALWKPSFRNKLKATRLSFWIMYKTLQKFYYFSK